MGYISIQINKAKGSADTGASDHIERKTIPKNADPTRTHLNRELVEFPDGVSDRTEAISHRIRTAGIKRKITPDQVRAIRIVLSGTHEDMMKIQDEGRLDEWCDDNLQWLHRKTIKTISLKLNIIKRPLHSIKCKKIKCLLNLKRSSIKNRLNQLMTGVQDKKYQANTVATVTKSITANTKN